MKLYRLDSLRFIAALLVIFVHFRGDIDSTYTNLDSIRSVIVLWIKNGSAGVIPPKRAASKSRINTSPAFSAGRVSLLKPSYAFALE